MVKFIYDGRMYNPSNFEKKLKKLGITKDDIEIIKESPREIPEDNGVIKYYYSHPSGYTARSIYNNDKYLIEHGFTLDK